MKEYKFSKSRLTDYLSSNVSYFALKVLQAITDSIYFKDDNLREKLLNVR